MVSFDLCLCLWFLSLSLIFVATWTILGSALLPSLNSSIVSRSSWHWNHYYTKTHPDCFSIIFPVHFLIIVLCNNKKLQDHFHIIFCVPALLLAFFALMHNCTIALTLFLSICSKIFATRVSGLASSPSVETWPWKGSIIMMPICYILGNIREDYTSKVSTNCVALRTI